MVWQEGYGGRNARRCRDSTRTNKETYAHQIHNRTSNLQTQAQMPDDNKKANTEKRTTTQTETINLTNEQRDETEMNTETHEHPNSTAQKEQNETNNTIEPVLETTNI